MRFAFYFILLLFLFTHRSSGQNLIPDPGFERSTVISSTGVWFSPNQSTPDILGESQKQYGSAYACKGRRSAGIILYDEDNPGFREYVACRFTQPLLKDSCYELSFWVLASAGSYYLTDAFGLSITDSLPLANHSGLIQTKLIWKQAAREIISDGSGWKQIKIRIKASGNEQYLILGNFNDDEHTLLKINNKKSVFRLAYLQLDEFNMEPCFKSKIQEPQKSLQKKGNLFIPNLITPNNDGFNDEFFIPGLPAYTGIIITDAKGKKVFSEKSYLNNWNGDQLPAGKYNYELFLPDGNIIYGSFDLVRKNSAPRTKSKK